ncbi:MAG: type VI secretion system ATPase TssH, partial [Acidobacteria bacterium]|nr:type VI secretion system ATPase TssH [Acidobacteriota bacterium]
MDDLKTLISALNPTCRKALEDAAAQCVHHGHHSIEVEHLLLELLKKHKSDVRAILKHLGLDPQVMQQELEKTLYGFKGGHTKVPTFSAQVPRLLREAWLIASLQLGAHRVRSGAILMACRTVEGLRDLLAQSAPSLRAIDPDTLRRELRDVVAHTGESASAGAGPLTAPPPIDLAPETVHDDTEALDQYTVDLTARARAGEIDPIIGRDREIRQVIDILARRRQNNPIL